jgi:hypothetical protein
MYLRNELGDLRVIRRLGSEYGGINGRSICSGGSPCTARHPDSKL